VRADRIEREQGLTAEAARDYIQDADRDLAARVRFLYHLDWDDPLLYDIVINTERTSVPRAVAMLRERLLDDRLAPTEASHRALRDRSLGALARAALLANPATRPRAIGVRVADGSVELTGRVETDTERRTAENAVARIPGVAGVRNELVIVAGSENLLAHGQFRHGEERSWGGYGGGSYDRDQPEPPRPENDRRP
jgi:hypothetical protein